MNKEPKIVFIHKGDSWFLPYAINQAAAFNPENVILLTDTPKKNNAYGVKQIPFNLSDSEAITQFKKHYQHMSTNSAKFEIFCWVRWFHLLDLMKQENLKSVFYLDTDVLLYASAHEMFNHYSESHDLWCGFSIPEHSEESMDWTASAHTSFWTLESLESFCQFITQSFSDPNLLEKYQQKWSWHQENKSPGGICDMTTLFLFWKKHAAKINNFAKSQHQGVIDHNVNLSLNYSADEYLLHRKIKAITIENNLCSFRKKSTNSPIRTFSAHFQGGAKKYMPLFYRGPRFYLKSPQKSIRHLGKTLRGFKKFYLS